MSCTSLKNLIHRSQAQSMFLLGEFHGHLSLWVPFKHFYKEFQSVVSKIIQWLNLKVMSDFWNLKSWPECRGKKNACTNGSNSYKAVKQE